MSALRRITRVEAKLALREPAGVFWGIVFPALLLIVLGFVFPGGRDPNPDLGGARLVDLYVPIALALGLATVAFAMLPPNLGGYRERGLFRRLSTTPVRPWRLVVAQLNVQFGLAVVAFLVLLATAVFVFSIPLPQDPLGFVVAFVLSALSMLAVGLLIGGLAPTAAAGQGMGLGVYFPMLFFAGVYFPREVMPEVLQRISDLTPAGAAVQALGDTWAGQGLPLPSLLVMAAYLIVAGVVAAATFRWE